MPHSVKVQRIFSRSQPWSITEATASLIRVHVSPELSLTVAAAVPNSMFIEYIPQMEPVLQRKIRIVEGYAIPLDVPGHGIEFKGYEVNS